MSTLNHTFCSILLAIASATTLSSALAQAYSTNEGRNAGLPLVGSWRDDGAGDFVANFNFTGDGDFTYDARFAPVGVTINEYGKYTVERDNLTLIPEKKIYDKYGSRSEDKLVMRTYKWQIEQLPQVGRRLTLMINGTVHRYAEQ